MESTADERSSPDRHPAKIHAQIYAPPNLIGNQEVAFKHLNIPAFFDPVRELSVNILNENGELAH
jgi:hypothetical protein